jgi:hypothetical protein
MAIGKASDMKVYHEEFQSGMVEKVAQYLAIFNEGTRGAIRLIPRALKGDYSKAAFFKDVSSLVSRRDTTSVSAATDLAMTQDEVISVKLNRKVGPVAQTLDAIKKANLTEAEASRVFGQLAGERKIKDMIAAALNAGYAAIAGTTALVSDVSVTTGTKILLTPSSLNTTLALFGDAANDIVCWVAHSKPNFDVIGGLVAGTTTGLADVATIQGALPGYLGRPVIVTDAAPLTFTDTFVKYRTLGLVRDAIVVEESEDESFATEIVTGLENLVRRWQSEHAFNVSVKGYKWDTANGGANPNDTALTTSSNWDKVASDNKLTAGVMNITN